MQHYEIFRGKGKKNNINGLHLFVGVIFSRRHYHRRPSLQPYVHLKYFEL